MHKIVPKIVNQKSLINRLRKRFYCIDPTRQSLKAVFHYFRIHPVSQCDQMAR